MEKVSVIELGIFKHFSSRTTEIQFVQIILLTLYFLLLEHSYFGDCHQCHFVKDITLKTRG